MKQHASNPEILKDTPFRTKRGLKKFSFSKSRRERPCCCTEKKKNAFPGLEHSARYSVTYSAPAFTAKFKGRTWLCRGRLQWPGKTSAAGEVAARQQHAKRPATRSGERQLRTRVAQENCARARTSCAMTYTPAEILKFERRRWVEGVCVLAAAILSSVQLQGLQQFGLWIVSGSWKKGN